MLWCALTSRCSIRTLGPARLIRSRSPRHSVRTCTPVKPRDQVTASFSPGVFSLVCLSLSLSHTHTRIYTLLLPPSQPVVPATRSRAYTETFSFFRDKERGALAGPGIEAQSQQQRQNGICHEHSCCLPTNPCAGPLAAARGIGPLLRGRTSACGATQQLPCRNDGRCSRINESE